MADLKETAQAGAISGFMGLLVGVLGFSMPFMIGSALFTFSSLNGAAKKK